MLKIALFGEPDVGKTTLINKLAENRHVVKCNELGLISYEIYFKNDIKLKIYTDEGRNKVYPETDISLFILDRFPETFPETVNNCKNIFCINKADMLDNIFPEHNGNLPENLLFISALNGQGIDSLADSILQFQ